MFPGLRQLWVEFFPTPGRLIEGRFNGRYPRRLFTRDQPFEVDFVLGATMMLRREVIETVGMFDENFFMYCEEIDWAWRIRKVGWKVLCVPKAHVIHLAGQSTSQIKPQSAIYLWTSRLRLYKRHQPMWKVKIAKWMIAAGMRRKMRVAEPSLREAYETIWIKAKKKD
jgi:GT2 family glycosyltransferase